MGIETMPYDAAEFLTDEETISAYLTEALESDDPRYIAKALGAVARARGGMAQLAHDTGIAREALYRALSDAGNPELGTALKVIHALGVRLSASLMIRPEISLRFPTLAPEKRRKDGARRS